jgi:two-component sensor histidine kinase
LELAKQVLENNNEHLDQIVSMRTDDLKRALRHNELLLQEVHHRVKNNLQLISSMVSLQARTGTASTLAENIRRQVEAIAISYDIMHRKQNVEVIDFTDVLRELCKAVSEANSDSVSLTMEIEPQVLVSAETAVALSLAVNEIVTNSIKHRRCGTVRASVSVCCSREESWALLRITDDGPGFPAGFDFESSSGFGMRMVVSVLSRVEGKLHHSAAGSGCSIEVRVPAVAAEQVESASDR